MTNKEVALKRLTSLTKLTSDQIQALQPYQKDLLKKDLRVLELFKILEDDRQVEMILKPDYFGTIDSSNFLVHPLEKLVDARLTHPTISTLVADVQVQPETVEPTTKTEKVKRPYNKKVKTDAS